MRRSKSSGDRILNSLPSRLTVTLPIRQHLDEALQIFADRPTFKPERCRALFKRGVVEQSLGHVESSTANRDQSSQLYREFLPKGAKAFATITEADADELVAFWSR